jgi:sugar phosphate isomerase/epimerase
MELIGKTAPLPGDLRRAYEDGFDKVELYMREEFLTPRHLKFLSDAKMEFGMEFYSIHTPHSKPDRFFDTVRQTKEFAAKAGIKIIVVHSSFVNSFSPQVLKICKGNLLPENSYIHNLPVMEKALKKGQKICLDTSHLFVSSLSTGRDYYNDLEALLKKYGRQVGHVHICDATEDFIGKKVDDTKNFCTDIGDGEIDFFKVVPILKKYYDGVAVIETWQQARDLDRIKKIMSFRPRGASVARKLRRPQIR